MKFGLPLLAIGLLLLVGSSALAMIDPSQTNSLEKTMWFLGGYSLPVEARQGIQVSYQSTEIPLPTDVTNRDVKVIRRAYITFSIPEGEFTNPRLEVTIDRAGSKLESGFFVCVFTAVFGTLDGNDWDVPKAATVRFNTANFNRVDTVEIPLTSIGNGQFILQHEFEEESLSGYYTYATFSYVKLLLDPVQPPTEPTPSEPTPPTSTEPILEPEPVIIPVSSGISRSVQILGFALAGLGALLWVMKR